MRGRYDLINIKLDKTGGLTEALALADEAERLGFGLFVGCMVASSLAMAPALLLHGRARASSISTARCCWRRTARTDCVSRARRSIRPKARCGGEEHPSLHRRGLQNAHHSARAGTAPALRMTVRRSRGSAGFPGAHDFRLAPDLDLQFALDDGERHSTEPR